MITVDGRNLANQSSDRAIAVTPSDTATLPFVTKMLYIGGAGNIAVDMLGGGTITYMGVPVGSQLYLGVVRVRATNTTATNIVACG